MRFLIASRWVTVAVVVVRAISRSYRSVEINSSRVITIGWLTCLVSTAMRLRYRQCRS